MQVLLLVIHLNTNMTSNILHLLTSIGATVIGKHNGILDTLSPRDGLSCCGRKA